MNQRGGYYIPAGTKYNTLSWTEAGTTDKAYPVVGYVGQDPLINVNGTNYITGKAAQIPGYCAGGVYTIDRWLSSTHDKTVKIADDHLTITDAADYGAFLQRFEYKELLGRTVTFSVLAKRTAAGAQVPYITVMVGNNTFAGYGMIEESNDYQIASCTVTLSDTAPSEGYFFVDIVGMAGSSIDIKAGKLELGDTQTLAHKENGVWVLNEVPDYGEQLARCLRYYIVTGANHFFSGWCTTTEKFWTHISTPVPMRAIPAISVIEPGNVIFGTSGANLKTSANQYEIENADATGIKMAVNIAGLSLGAGILCDGKYAFSADL